MKATKKNKRTIPARVVKRVPQNGRGTAVVFLADVTNKSMAPIHDPFTAAFAE